MIIYIYNIYVYIYIQYIYIQYIYIYIDTLCFTSPLELPLGAAPKQRATEMQRRRRQGLAERALNPLGPWRRQPCSHGPCMGSDPSQKQ